jgi:hypothetical protein
MIAAFKGMTKIEESCFFESHQPVSGDRPISELDLLMGSAKKLMTGGWTPPNKPLYDHPKNLKYVWFSVYEALNIFKKGWI